MDSQEKNRGPEADDPGQSGECQIMRSTQDVRKINPGRLPETTWIDMVELGKGCDGDCISCGAFGGEFNPEERIVRAITPEKLVDNLSQEIVDARTGTRLRLVDLFRSYVTTGVDMEPLSSDIFCDAAQIIYEMSDHKSRLVAISHGLRAIETEDGFRVVLNQLERLKKINNLMLNGVVPLFVLTMDSARDKGLMGKKAKELNAEIGLLEAEFETLVQQYCVNQQKKEGLTNPEKEEDYSRWQERLKAARKKIQASVAKKVSNGVELGLNEKKVKEYMNKKAEVRKAVVEANAYAYAATLNALKGAIFAKKRVTISLQGDDDESSRVYTGFAFEIQQKTNDILMEQFGWTVVEATEAFEELLSIEPPRLYISAGRAKNFANILDEDRSCMVIPDGEFTATEFRRDPYKVNRGRLRADGGLQIQVYKYRETYNTTVNPTSSNPWKDVDLDDDVEIVDIEGMPKTFCDWVKQSAAPRYAAVYDEGVYRVFSDVYPLNMLEDDKRNEIERRAKEYFADVFSIDVTKGGDSEELDLESFMSRDAVRELILKMLIPDEIAANYRQDEDETLEDTKKRLAETIIDLHTLTGIDETGNKDDYRRRAVVLAIQTMIKYTKIKEDFKLADE